MAGSIRLSMEREPSYFASLDAEAERHDTVVLEDPRDGRIVAMGARLVHSATLDGEPVRMGYLNQLRVASRRRIGRKALREGWELLLSRRRAPELPFDWTSIAADNRAARRLLERGLPGLPRYHPISAYEVLAISTHVRGADRPNIEVREADAPEWAHVLEIFEAQVSDAALVLRWRGTSTAQGIPAERVPPTLRLVARARRNGHHLEAVPERDRPARGDGPVVAGLAVVDPTAWRQYVVRGYEGPLGWTRPLANLALRLAGAPRLPPPGGRLRSGFVAGLCCLPDHTDAVPALFWEAARWARRRGLSTLLYGAPEGDRWAWELGRRFRPRRYRTIHYLVSRADPGPVLERLRSGPIHVEPLLL